MTQQDFFNRYTYSPSRDRIGGGGFGTVYKAKDNLLHRTVAIKVSEVKTTADGQKTFSLKDEFEALAHVPKHPNIANYEEFYSFESPQGLFDYAVMQFYPDGNLSNAIKKGLTAEQKEDIATQLLEGIAFLHQHKVVHRDLKPGNILIVKDGDKIIPLITDFGLSKAAGVVDGSVFSNSFGGGTPRYSSPEQLQGLPLRFNTDLWSYGAIIYELFTGTQLFSASSGAANTAQVDMEIYNKIVNGNVQNLDRMPEKWSRVAERCLVVDPTKRAKDASEMFAIIEGDTDDETEVTKDSTTGSVSPSRGAFSPKVDFVWWAQPRRWGLWVGMGIAAAAVVALLVLFLKPKKESLPTNSDAQAYESCQTVDDYRAYMRSFGTNALHYNDAKMFVEQHEADSTAKAQQAATLAQAQQQAGAEAKAKAQAESEKKEEAAYKKSTTIAGCDSYLKAYPNGKYVQEVRTKKAQLEVQAQQQAPTTPAQQSSSGSAGGHDYIDLGLPSGTLWATCNIGANNPEDYGNYYAWGETSPKSTYGWGTYKYTNGDNGLTKYCNKSDYGNNGFTDDITKLQSSDDPATAWGKGWHTPTKAQWDELLSNTTNKWTTINSVKGQQFTSKKNGQTLFLPAAGDIWSVGHIRAGSYGAYWSCLLYTDDPRNAWFYQLGAPNCREGNRCAGFSVRPVRE